MLESDYDVVDCFLLLRPHMSMEGSLNDNPYEQNTLSPPIVKMLKREGFEFPSTSLELEL